MADAAEKTVVRVVSFCLMPNHWHLVVWPHAGAEIPSYMQILMNSHLRDLMRRHDTAGEGHFYKGRYRPHPIENHRHFLNVCRYVEANARRAKLCDRAEDWPWSSLSCCGPDPDVNLLSPWPIARPRDWMDQVNAPRLQRPTAKGWRVFDDRDPQKIIVSPSVAVEGNQRRQILT